MQGLEVLLLIIINNTGSWNEIRARTSMAKMAIAKLTKINKITINSKIPLVHTLIFPNAQYASESWT